MVFPSFHALAARLVRWTLTGAAAAVVVLAAAACSPAGSIESADVPAWKATALPSAPGTVLEDAGKILNRNPIVRAASGVPAGTYTLTMTCDGGGKAFFAVSLDGSQLAEQEPPAMAAARPPASRCPPRAKSRSAPPVWMPRSSTPTTWQHPSKVRPKPAGVRPSALYQGPLMGPPDPDLWPLVLDPGQP